MLRKLNCHVARVGILLTMVAFIAGMVGCDGYNPPPVKELEIRTWYDLDAVRHDMGGSYILMNDLDSTTAGYEELASPTANGGEGWKPIGWGGWGWTWFGVKAFGEVFKGTFDGQGYEIRDPYIISQGQVGLFGFAHGGAMIKNIALINATVTEGDAAGVSVGVDGATVRCFDVAPAGGVGGLVGYNGGTVSNCYVMGNITGGLDVGGLVGFNGGTVSNCYATGSVCGGEDVGGLVGLNLGAVSNCYCSGSVTGNYVAGGLVGSNGGTVGNCFWDTETSRQATSTGGTGKTTAEMRHITTFSGAGWNITAVANPGVRNPSYIWNIVNGVTYPFLSWQAI